MNIERLKFLETQLLGLRQRLQEHRLYNSIETVDDIKIFMQSHVFAVWDFMSLLKALQFQLTNTSIPWVPRESAVLERFINELVLAEETDVDQKGEYKSHLEMYLDAMLQIGADTTLMNELIELIKQGVKLESSLEMVQIDKGVLKFVQFTFAIIANQKTHLIAAAFAFGREGIIPDMFLRILKKMNPKNEEYNKLTYYLQRHIELDGDQHGPFSMRMISELCGEDNLKWEETLDVAKKVINQRIQLWDTIALSIDKAKSTKFASNLSQSI